MDSDLLEPLVALLGRENVLTRPEDLQQYSTDALSPFRAFRAAPLLERRAQVVVTPRSTQQVADLVKFAARHGLPLVPHGGGTGVMGGAVPVRGGMVVDLQRMDRVLEVDPLALTATVEAGIILEKLQQHLEQHGLMLGHEPWSVPIATVGGAISTNGVGYRASRYGPMGAQVLGLQVVLPSGQVLDTRAVPKYASGPNLNHLFIGSEGAFGIITRATLQVFPLPEKRSFTTFAFDSFDQGFHAVVEFFNRGLRPALLDLTEERYGDNGGVLLYLMFEGTAEEVEGQEQGVRRVCLQAGGRDLGPEETVHYWDTRYDIALRFKAERTNSGAARRPRPSRRGRGFDYLHVSLPSSRVLEYKHWCQDYLPQHGVEVREYAIWTRPEFFSLFLVPTGGPSGPDADRLAQVVDRVLEKAQDLGGSMEYCHGVGVKLAHLVAREMGVGLEVVRALKEALDPHNIMNPGKLGL